MKRFKVEVSCDLRGYLSYGHYEGIVEAETAKEARAEAIESNFRDFDLIVDGCDVEDSDIFEGTTTVTEMAGTPTTWVSTLELEPEEADEYLALYKGNPRIMSWAFNEKRNGYSWFLYNDFLSEYIEVSPILVTHWMAIPPTPPQEEIK